ncbi:MAG: molybdopterin converting factor subunit 1 [Chromatiaceae bacterium]|nr:MAG: molybdopterin converting factor subunit 1 [Chromatiaceae bacterium]
MNHAVRILYFASLREHVGIAEEDLRIDAGTTVHHLLERLRARDSTWAQALGPSQRIMVSVNQELARPETPLGAGDEVAFFPPVTGG